MKIGSGANISVGGRKLGIGTMRDAVINATREASELGAQAIRNA